MGRPFDFHLFCDKIEVSLRTIDARLRHVVTIIQYIAWLKCQIRIVVHIDELGNGLVVEPVCSFIWAQPHVLTLRINLVKMPLL